MSKCRALTPVASSLLCVIGWLLYTIRSTLAPFFIAFVLSYLLMPLVDLLESYRVNRLAAVAGVLMGVFAIVVIPLIYVARPFLSGAEGMGRVEFTQCIKCSK